RAEGRAGRRGHDREGQLRRRVPLHGCAARDRRARGGDGVGRRRPRVHRGDLTADGGRREDSRPPSAVQEMNEPRHVRLTGARKIIAERMLRSHLEYAELTVVREVDVTPLVTLRERLVAAPERLGGVRASYTHLIAYVVARALPAHPFLNSTLVENE